MRTPALVSVLGLGLPGCGAGAPPPRAEPPAAVVLARPAASPAAPTEADCVRGNAVACVEAGQAYANGVGVPKDATKAADRYTKACDEGNAAGCFWLGDAFVHGLGIGKDELRGVTLLRRACEA